MFGWVLNLAYGAALVVTGPVWLARMIRHGKYRRGWRQRLGRAPRSYGLQPVIWIHGVSVGEVNAAGKLVDELHSQMPDFRVVVSATTDTGLAAAARRFGPDHAVFRYPVDFTFAVGAALKRVRPTLVILMEGDVWPNFVAGCRRRDIPVVVVNGRLGPRKGYPRYRRFRRVAGKLFGDLSAIGVQHETYAEMFRSLGVADEKIHVTGMMKYDSAEIADAVAGQDALAAALGLDDAAPLLVAGGTGSGEEAVVLDAFDGLGAEGRFAAVRLAIVPRKPERFEEVARLIASRGGSLVRRSERPDGSAGTTPPGGVILGDTMGDLRKFYALADAVFVGRSLVPEGGSDMIEAAALAKPVALGPHTFNFPQADTMAEAQAVRRVADAAELARAWEDWLTDPDRAAAEGRKARDFVRAQQGATRRNVEMICGLLGRRPAVRPGAIAMDLVREQA